MSSLLRAWLADKLVCPVDRGALEHHPERLTCAAGHQFPIVDGIPVFLMDGVDSTHPYFDESLQAARGATSESAASKSSEVQVDPFVQDEIVKTNGNLYRHLEGRLPRYPIPTLRLPPGDGKLLLDVGCNWGRWTLSAARQGYRAVGIDPGLNAVRAARRVADQLGLEALFLVGDARRLPFADGTFDAGFSYSVFQHFDKQDAQSAIRELSRVTVLGGTVLVQMANLLGVRQAYNRLRQIMSRDSNKFRVRYWLPGELQTTFDKIVGPSRLDVDGFFSLNAQPTDLDLMDAFHGWVVRSSELLRAASRSVPALKKVADSLYIESSNQRTFERT